MPSILPFFVTLFLFLPAGASGARGLRNCERAARAPQAEPALALLRAGAASSRIELAQDERAALTRAARDQRGLQDLRAGEITLSDRDVKVILITAAAVLVLVLIF